MELEIDGTGGIYPGNSYHSTYLPKRYKEDALFQVFNVTHQISSAGWTTSLSGKMRSNLARLIKSVFVERGMKSILEQFNEAMLKNKGKVCGSILALCLFAWSKSLNFKFVSASAWVFKSLWHPL